MRILGKRCVLIWCSILTVFLIGNSSVFAQESKIKFSEFRGLILTRQDKITIEDVPDHIIEIGEFRLHSYVLKGGDSPGELESCKGVFISDLVSGNGSIQGYIIDTIKDGGTVFTKYEGTVKTTKTPGKPSITELSGTFKFMGGSGDFKDIQGSGNFGGKLTPRISWDTGDYALELEGEYSLPKK